MSARVSEITVDGVRLAVDRVGQGPTVVCLTAICHDAADFDPLAARLGAAFEFVRLEWPSHGRSGPDHAPASPARYAELVGMALDALGIERPILIGNSIGGAAAILVASRRPVAGLVICDSGGLVEVNATVRRACRLGASFFRAGERGRGWFGTAFGLYYRLVLPSSSARAQRERIVRGAYATARSAREAWESFGRPEADIRAVAARLNAPVWAAWAKKDRVIPLHLCRVAIEAIPGVAISLFDGGHSAFLEQPDAFAEGFRAFAARLPLGAAVRAGSCS
jgi:4,5:9,10-diseco-3-hydroxy-5,9,17-trioxoandrosta-1(10),2-diene-4-oate hydrolase